MTRIQSILHSITTAPDYYYHHFFCPVKRDTILLAYSAIAISCSWCLNEISVFLEYFSATWAMVAKVLSALTLLMNFVMVLLALSKRIRDWGIKEPAEGQKEFDKHNKSKP